MPFGRNRESRSREAAGRRNWPEAVPRKMRGRKKATCEISQNRDKEQTWLRNSADYSYRKATTGSTRIARRAGAHDAASTTLARSVAANKYVRLSVRETP